MNNILHETEEYVAGLLSADGQLSACPFLVENSKDIEFQIKNSLGRQGIVGVVHIPKATYAGSFQDVGLAWQIDELQVNVVENVPVNRGKKDGFITCQDACMRVFDVLCPLSGDREGQFSPVDFQEGEDSGLLVAKAVLKCLVHKDAPPPPPPEPTNSKFTVNGASYEYDLSSLTQTWMKEQGWLSPSNFWLVRLTRFETGTNLSSIGPNCFIGCTSLEQATIGAEVESLGQTCFAGCTGLELLMFKGRTLEQVQAMTKYPWGLADTSVIHAEL